MKRCRRASGADSGEEVSLRSTFLEKYGAKLRLWLLETCTFSIGARRQRLWHTFLAKFYGLSRTGILQLSNLGVLSPLTSLDRHWKTLLFKYRASVRYDSRLYFGGSDSRRSVCQCANTPILKTSSEVTYVGLAKNRTLRTGVLWSMLESLVF